MKTPNISPQPKGGKKETWMPWWLVGCLDGDAPVVMQW